MSWLQSPSAVILEPRKSQPLFPLFPHLFSMKSWYQVHDLIFLNVEL